MTETSYRGPINTRRHRGRRGREPLNWVILYKLQTIRRLRDWNQVGKSGCITLPKPKLLVLHII